MRPRRILSSLVVSGLCLTCTVNAVAQDQIYSINIKQTDAVTALNMLGAQTEHPLLFDYNQVKSKHVNALSGQFTLQQALNLILKDTGLSGNLSEREIISITVEPRNQTQAEDEDMNFKGTKKTLVSSASAAIMATAGALPAVAQTSSEPIIDEIITVGSRSSKPRSSADSPVPVDSLNAETFNSLGGAADITDNLKVLVPSFNALPATGDGSAFVRPTSLRGTSPDQTLVLVNGKRRHRSALVQFFAPAAGNGAHGPDVGMIPGIALKQVDVLRDGAAAQYGSDAIAGVINFVTRTAPDGGEVAVQYGQHYEGERNYKIGANIGVGLGQDGYFNISGEYTDNEALSRGFQRPDAAALIAAGNQGVGADTPFGDAPFAQTWGRPETSGIKLFANAGYELGNGAELYAFGNFAQTDGRYRFFYRNPGHSSLNALVNDFGYTGRLLETGYTPFLDGAQRDNSLVGGLRGETDGGINYDFSISHGENELDYFLNNTTNASLGLGADGEPIQRDFDPGALGQKEFNINADFSKALGDNLNLAVGGEYREETYTITAGEENSFQGSGSNGLRGFGDLSAGEFSRDNVAIYADIEHDISDAILLQYAARFEDFSDFGSTLNWKLAGRVKLSDAFTLRAAASTGFHAPTPGQANISTTITTFDGATGLQVEEGLVPATSDAARAVGGAPLKEETSTNFSIGGSADLFGNSTLSIDLYKIDVEDRIYRTGDITNPNGGTISFYTNALDVDHEGIDLVFTSKFDLSDSISTDMSLAANYNKINVAGQTQVQTPTGLINPVSASTIEDIENNYPEFKGVLSFNTHFGDQWHWLARANYTGSHFDERGTIGAATNPSAKIDPVVYFDTEVSYDVNDNITFAVGGSNIFDSFPNEIDAPNANRQSVGLQYPRRTAANYEGGSWYAKARYRF